MRNRVIALLLVVLSSCAVIQRSSVAPSGETDGASVEAALNGSGTAVAFASTATNLVPGDTNGVADVFVRDGGQVSRVSVATDGSVGNGPSSHPSMSSDGRYVAFQSDATNLVAGDTNATTDIFVRDRTANTTTLVSVPAPGAPATAAAAGSVTANASPAPTTPANASSGTSDALRTASLQARALRAPVRVIVHTATAFQPEGHLGAVRRTQQRAEIRRDQDTVGNLIGGGGTIAARAHTLPLVVATVDAGALDRLLASPTVVGVTPDDPVPAALANSGPVVGLPAVQDAGFTGRGVTVAILDTGVDASHPFLGGRVVDESCFSGLASCPNGLQTQTGPGAAAPCTYAPVGCRHGTHVAGIAAGSALDATGVAPRASIIAVQIFSRVDSTTFCTRGENPCPLTFPSDWILGLEHVYELRDTYRIAAVNMSIGGIPFPGACDTDAVKPAIDQLRSVGIATVIAAGNEGLTDAIDYPACISSSVAVGATDDADNIAGFSNSHPLISLFAPGVGVRSSVPGGGFAVFNGTSMATPHVTGAFALAKELNPNASVDDIVARMRATGRTIHDARNGLDIPRLCTSGTLGFDRCPNHNASRRPDISADGQKVAFESDAPLVAADTNATTDIYLRDLGAGTTERVSITSAGAQATGASTHPSMTNDAQRIAFDSLATDLVPNDTNGVSDVFTYDRPTHVTQRISVALSGAQGTAPSRDAAIAGFGNVIAFTSGNAFSTLDTNTVADVYSIQGPAPRLISQGPGFAAANGPSRHPSLSDDGRRVAFESDATNLAPDPNSETDVFIRDIGSGITQRTSTDFWLRGGNGPSWSAVISHTGADVVFASRASDLITPPDGNLFADIYERTALAPTPNGALPSTVARGAHNVGFTITGAGFDLAVIVDAGPGVTVTITTNGATALSGTISVTAGATPGPRNIWVTNLAGSGFSSGLCAGCLTIT